MKVNDSATSKNRPPLLLAAARDFPRQLVRDASGSAIGCGIIAILIGYAGPAVIVLSAARNADLTAAQSSSWIWATSIGSGALCLILSAWTRQPILIAWSTPGAALLVTSLGRYSYDEVIFCYLLVALATIVVGWRGWFGALVGRIPGPLVSAMLAGILFTFGAGAFSALSARPLVPAAILLGFLLGSYFRDQAAVPTALAAGVAAAGLTGQVQLSNINLHLAQPVFTAPAFSISAIIGIGLPLFIVTMTAQNAAGLTVLTTHGYVPNDRKLITATGIGSFILAPFGAHAINLAAIVAAICAGPAAHRDPARRYVAGLSGGVCYLIGGSFAGAIVGVFAGLPSELVATLAGVALLGSLAGALGASMSQEQHRMGAVITLLVTVSGLSIGGIGSACWGLVFGVLADAAFRARDRRGARQLQREPAPAQN